MAELRARKAKAKAKKEASVRRASYRGPPPYRRPKEKGVEYCACYDAGPTVGDLGACYPCIAAWLKHRLTLPPLERFEGGLIPVRPQPPLPDMRTAVQRALARHIESAPPFSGGGA